MYSSSGTKTPFRSLEETHFWTSLEWYCLSRGCPLDFSAPEVLEEVVKPICVSREEELEAVLVPQHDMLASPLSVLEEERAAVNDEQGLLE